jgi:carbon starvation protein CstA
MEVMMILLLVGMITGLLIIYTAGEIFERHAVTASIMMYAGFAAFTGGIAHFIRKDMGLDFNVYLLVGFVVVISAIAAGYLIDNFRVESKRKKQKIYYEVED